MEQTTLEGNRVIAEFMGKAKRCDSYGVDIICVEGAPTNHLFEKTKSMKYKTDWNWLMPVISKIADVTLRKKTVNEKPFRRIYGMSLFTEIEAVYSAVVDFIETYNQQTNSK